MVDCGSVSVVDVESKVYVDTCELIHTPSEVTPDEQVTARAVVVNETERDADVSVQFYANGEQYASNPGFTRAGQENEIIASFYPSDHNITSGDIDVTSEAVDIELDMPGSSPRQTSGIVSGISSRLRKSPKRRL